MGASCEKKTETPEAEALAAEGGEEQAAEAGEPGAAVGAKADEDEAQGDVADDVYPDFNFEPFNQEERQKIVGIAKAELCPCPESTVSLHECLLKKETQCEAAKYSAVIIASGTQEKKSQTDILDALAKYADAIKKTHEFALEGVPMKGNPEAKVVLVEFADFQCPYCRMVSGELKKVHEKYGDTIAIYYKQFPLPMHSHAKVASAASLAAHKQQRFWQMHDLLYENQQALSNAKIKGLAQKIGLDSGKFVKDLEDPTIVGQVERDRAEGEKAGLTGTPTIFVNGKRYMGELDSEALGAYIDTFLGEDKK